MTNFTALVAIAAAAQVAACARQPAAPLASAQAAGGQCFSASQVRGFSAISDTAVDVEVGASRYFRLQLAGYCPNVDRSLGIGLRTSGGGSWICSGMDAELIVPEIGGPQRCLVTAVQPISREQWLAARRR